MAKNRKTKATPVWLGPAVKTFLLCLVIGGVGVGYVEQKNGIDLLSEQMKKLEIRREQLLRERAGLLRKLTALQSASRLEAQVWNMDLGLAPVSPDQIIHLAVPSANKTDSSSKPKRREEFAQVRP